MTELRDGITFLHGIHEQTKLESFESNALTIFDHTFMRRVSWICKFVINLIDVLVNLTSKSLIMSSMYWHLCTWGMLFWWFPLTEQLICSIWERIWSGMFVFLGRMLTCILPFNAVCLDPCYYGLDYLIILSVVMWLYHWIPPFLIHRVFACCLLIWIKVTPL